MIIISLLLVSNLVAPTNCDKIENLGKLISHRYEVRLLLSACQKVTMGYLKINFNDQTCTFTEDNTYHMKITPQRP